MLSTKNYMSVNAVIDPNNPKLLILLFSRRKDLSFGSPGRAPFIALEDAIKISSLLVGPTKSGRGPDIALLPT